MFIIWINRIIPKDRGWFIKGMKIIIKVIKIIIILKIIQRIVYKKY